MFAPSKPAPDDIEVSILGGGNGYGECIVIHTGFDHWIVVDSAIDPGSKKPLALSYFEEMGVDHAAVVQMIIASHWHDDHIKGLSDVVSQCPNAVFVCSQALEQKQFLVLLGLDDNIPSPNSGIKEFHAIFHQLKSTGKAIKRGVQDRIVWKSLHSGSTFLEVITLSPSDEAIGLFENQQLRQLLADLESGPASVVRDISPNHTSLVTVVKIGEETICLGGDLENTSKHAMGWQAVLQAQLVPKNTVSLFKVPHHGSQNAYSPEFWNLAMAPDPLAGLTPYARGKKKLPSPSDIANIYRHTAYAYITAPLERGKEKTRDPKAKKMIRDLGYDVREIPFSFGHIRFRKKIGQTDQPWIVTLRGSAMALKSINE